LNASKACPSEILLVAFLDMPHAWACPEVIEFIGKLQNYKFSPNQFWAAICRLPSYLRE